MSFLLSHWFNSLFLYIHSLFLENTSFPSVYLILTYHHYLFFHTHFLPLFFKSIFLAFYHTTFFCVIPPSPVFRTPFPVFIPHPPFPFIPSDSCCSLVVCHRIFLPLHFPFFSITCPPLSLIFSCPCCLASFCISSLLQYLRGP